MPGIVFNWLGARDGARARTTQAFRPVRARMHHSSPSPTLISPCLRSLILGQLARGGVSQPRPSVADPELTCSLWGLSAQVSVANSEPICSEDLVSPGLGSPVLCQPVPGGAHQPGPSVTNLGSTCSYLLLVELFSPGVWSPILSYFAPGGVYQPGLQSPLLSQFAPGGARHPRPLVVDSTSSRMGFLQSHVFLGQPIPIS